MSDHHTPQPDNRTPALGISGRIAAFFQQSSLTPLLAIIALLLGLFAVLVTPREEEPQIDVTMANVIIPFPGANVQDVESMVSSPAEQVLSQMVGVDHVYSTSLNGMSVVTVQFKVGVKRNDALVRLYDTVGAHADWLPQHLGVLAPIIKPKGIDDVPIVTLTLYRKAIDSDPLELEKVAHSLEVELKRIKGTRDIKTIGGPTRAIMIRIDPEKMRALSVSMQQLEDTLRSANFGAPIGQLIQNNRTIEIEAGQYFNRADDIADLVIGQRQGQPIFLNAIADIADSQPIPSQYVWFGQGGATSAHTTQPASAHTTTTFPAVTLSITKQSGENAIEVANAIQHRVKALTNSLIPADVIVHETRNYGQTANDKATKLIQKLLFATLLVVALVFFALGKREAAIVGSAVILTLTVTLFASWAWGFTLNRVSLFALIFSIGILVDDAIVVVENIHRHQQLFPHKHLFAIIPTAVNEVGGPTILATLTVIAALLPMAFVSGLMGPYMSPIPINASLGMLLSLAIAFTITPWLARKWLHATPHATSSSLNQRVQQLTQKLFHPLLFSNKSSRNRRVLALSIVGLIALSIALPVAGWVVLKMLPFDNKSEFQIIVDMPSDTPLEDTAAAMQALSDFLTTVPEVDNFQAYVGTSSPINFNGLVRQYDQRKGTALGDIQVNLVDKHYRKEQSHAIAMRLRPALQRIASVYHADLKVVEVPPGPPVLSPIVAEVYGPTEAGRIAVAKAVRQAFQHHKGMVDIDDSTIDVIPKQVLHIDRRKAARLGVNPATIVDTLKTALSGKTVTFLHDASKYPVPAIVQLPAAYQGDMHYLLQLSVPSTSGNMVAIRELVTLINTVQEQPRTHKDLLPVTYVVADMAKQQGQGTDSPLYGMFAVRKAIHAITAPNGAALQEYFIQQPEDTLHHYSIKWDGEWQITYETFRDMGIAYGVGLIFIYVLVVAQFSSYRIPLIIMAPIPLTLIGVMPGHALLGAQFTATSMIGMIALAGIIVRNSILLVDFIQLKTQEGMVLEQAIVAAVYTRAQPIFLTGLAAMLGALFILDDPIFNGLAISLIFGILVSTLLTLVVIPLLYYVSYRPKTKHARKLSSSTLS